jgi:hypothetical protein
MAFSEGLSDTGDLTGRGRPYLRGAITGVGTFLGGVLHTLPFLIPQYRSAVLLALAVIAFELLALAWIRTKSSCPATRAGRVVTPDLCIRPARDGASISRRPRGCRTYNATYGGVPEASA